MPTARSLRDEITNALDFLRESELVLYAPAVRLSNARVTWTTVSDRPFLIESRLANVGQYVSWVAGGHYSAVLPDASLIQLTYDVRGSKVVGHRLAYIPCPVIVDEGLLREGLPILDVVELYLDRVDAAWLLALRSPLRLDYDAAAASPGHPAAHLTINSADCRIACVAPVHPYRFLDLIFRQFYPTLWTAQEQWFAKAEQRLLGERAISEGDSSRVHISWPLHRFP